MDLYHIWCDLEPGVGDLEFSEAVAKYMGRLEGEGLIEGYRLTRKKLGLAPAELGEFHIVIETSDMAQLERAFQEVGTRGEPVEGLHHAVNSKVTNARFGLWRDFPDEFRKRGEERF